VSYKVEDRASRQQRGTGERAKDWFVGEVRDGEMLWSVEADPMCDSPAKAETSAVNAVHA
jgi:hypothetical protein